MDALVQLNFISQCLDIGAKFMDSPTSPKGEMLSKGRNVDL